MQRSQRLARELDKLAKSPPKGISVCQKETQLNLLEVQMIGPENTPYESGTFNIEILVPDNYPFSPPSIKFLTKVYHPNIDDNGRICLDLIKMPPKGSWKPTFGIENLLVAVRMLLQSPNPEDPLMADIAEEFLNDYGAFEAKVRSFCKEYAN